MKFKIKSTIAILASAILVGCSGCQTSTPSNTATEQLLVTTAAAAGTEIALQNNPQYAPDFVAGAVLLQQLAGNNAQLTVAQVQDALATAGQTNKTITLLTPLAVNVLNAYSANNGSTNGVALNASNSQVVTWIATGIQQGVAATGK